jgi:uncharacterized protein (DUF58 family)
MTRVLAFAALWLFVFGTALAGGWSVMFKISYLLLLLFGVAWLWTRLSQYALVIRREPLTPRSQVGEPVRERLSVSNTWWLPKPWLEVQADSALTGHQGRFFLSLPARATWSGLLESRATRRGLYLLGPTRVATGDPFGLFRHEWEFPADTSVLVYPATIDLPQFRPLQGALAGGGQRRERVPHATAMAAGLRDYQPGDPFNRIHWPNSARLGRLVVKEFEEDPVSDVWVVLDLDRNLHRAEGPTSPEEQGVTIAASVARHLLLQNRAVGLLTQRHVLEPDRGARQLLKILELLAVVRPREWQSVGALLLSTTARFGRGTSIIVITPTVRTDWLAALEDLRLRGIPSTVILQDTVAPDATSGLMALIAALAAARVPYYVVKPDQPLDQALGAPPAVEALARPV